MSEAILSSPTQIAVGHDAANVEQPIVIVLGNGCSLGMDVQMARFLANALNDAIKKVTQ